jgi:apolipoprotein N-acyltransferase
VTLLGLVAAGDVIGTASNQCDNMAGTCIRERQQAAILGVRALCLLAAVVPFGVLLLALAGQPRRRRWLLVAALAGCAAVGVAALAVQPVDHLNDRWGGWLHA